MANWWSFAKAMARILWSSSSLKEHVALVWQSTGERQMAAEFDLTAEVRHRWFRPFRHLSRSLLRQQDERLAEVGEVSCCFALADLRRIARDSGGIRYQPRREGQLKLPLWFTTNDHTDKIANLCISCP